MSARKVQLHACVALLFSATAWSAPHFVVSHTSARDLGTAGALASAAADINDRGEIVGWLYTGGPAHAFLYSGGVMTDIGPSITKGGSSATGINSHGQVVGWAYQQKGTQNQQLGFLWMPGYSQPLLGPGGSTSPDLTAGWKINDRGDIAGFTNQHWPYTFDAITWKASGVTILMPSTSHDDQAFDINASGSMTGYVNGTMDAWRWTMSGNVVTQSMAVPRPAPSGYTWGEGRAINDKGAIVGRFLMPSTNNWRAFFWDGQASRSVDLGTLPRGMASEAEDLNETRFIVGHATESIGSQPSQYRERAFVYHSDFGMMALPTLPATSKSDSCWASAVNEWNRGDSRLQIVGGCDTPVGSRAVLWSVAVSLVP